MKKSYTVANDFTITLDKEGVVDDNKHNLLSTQSVIKGITVTEYYHPVDHTLQYLQIFSKTDFTGSEYPDLVASV